MKNFEIKEVLRRKARKLLNGEVRKHRVCSCGKPRGGDVLVVESHGSRNFQNIETCGNVWTCAVCATKVTEKRRVEIRTAYDKHIDDGFIVGMLTLTFPHKAQDDLLVLSEREAKATKLFKQRQGWKKFRKVIKGTIRGFEITHGSNGWHLHNHQLVFFDKKTLTASDLDSYEKELYKAWAGACVSAGLPEPSEMHGVDLTLNAAGDYVSKWGLDMEMTKSHMKKGRKNSKTPFQLLASDDEKDNKHFVEFANVFLTKRKQQLRWSNGLKALFNIEVKTDEELNEEQSDGVVVNSVDSKTYFNFWIKGKAHLLLTDKTTTEARYDLALTHNHDMDNYPCRT